MRVSKAFRKTLAWLLKALRTFLLCLLIGWGALALYYSNLPWVGARVLLATGFVALSVWWLGFSGWRRAKVAFALLFGAVLIWFASIAPSHDRPWRPQVSVMPRVYRDGDRVRFTGYRNFDYRSRDDFTVRFEEREVLLSHLDSVDLYISYWKLGPVAHTMLSFGFDNAPPVCISIETRPEIGEGFNPLASLFKQFELIYVVGDERDLVRVRTDYRNEEVFLYPIRIRPEQARALFLVYLDRINELADKPEWYHLLKNSCTINIVRYANRAGRTGAFHIGHLLNGWVDRYLYQAGLLDPSLPFEQLRERARITDKARRAGNVQDFSRLLRMPQK